MKFVSATCSTQLAAGIVLFEPSDSGLPPGLLASPSLVSVAYGTASIPVVNVGTTDVLLYPRTSLGVLQYVHIVSLPNRFGHCLVDINQCRASFEALKGKLVAAPVLAYADFALPFVLEVDASLGGLGAVLSQEKNGRVRPLASASRGLRPAERNMTNYSSMKLEFLALKWAVTEKCKEYLWGNSFVVYTDNNPLSHLKSAKLGATEQRWASQLASFDLTLRYRSGKSNKVKKCRCPLTEKFCFLRNGKPPSCYYHSR